MYKDLRTLCVTFFLILILSLTGYGSITVTIPDSQGVQGENIEIPVRVENLTGMNVYAFGMELNFDAGILKAENVVITNTLVSSWGQPTVNIESGKIIVGAAGSVPLAGKGDLIKIKFAVVGTPGQSTVIQFAKMVFNEGDPAADTQNGTFTVVDIGNEIVVSLPDEIAKSGDKVTVPMTITDVTGRQIYSYGVNIKFDPSILQVDRTFSDGCISSVWGQPTYNVMGNDVLSIGGAGSSVLSGAGNLVKIEFNVVGGEGDVSPLQFISCTLNEGDPSVTTRDGSVSVQGGETSTLVVTPTSLTFTANVGETQQLKKNVQLSHTGPTSLSWSATEAYSWLQLSKMNGGTPETIEVIVDPTILNVGTHSAQVVISSPEASNSPVIVKVTMEIIDAVDNVIISLPDTLARPSERVSIPLSISDVTGKQVYSYGVQIKFDPSVVQAERAFSEGCLSSGWGQPTYNVIGNDVISIGGAGSKELNGTGCLVKIEFKILGKKDDVSPLEITSCTLNEGDPPVTTRDGSITVMDGDSSTLVITPNRFDITATQGQSQVVKKIMTISHTGETALSWAATVDSPWLQVSPANGTTPSNVDVIVDPSSLTTGSHSAEITISSAQASNSPVIVPVTVTISEPGEQVMVSLPDTSSYPGSVIAVPVTISDVTGKQVYSYGLKVKFDPNVLKVERAFSENCITNAWGQPTFNQIGDDEILIGGAGATVLDGTGYLVRIEFTVIGSAGDQSPLDFTLCILNEGDPPVVMENGSLNIIGTSVDDFPTLPTTLELTRNYPNPFNPSTHIRYALPQAAHVRLFIMNVLGQKIRSLEDMEKAPGRYEIIWDGKADSGMDAPSGSYLLVLRCGDFRQMIKIIKTK